MSCGRIVRSAFLTRQRIGSRVEPRLFFSRKWIHSTAVRYAEKEDEPVKFSTSKAATWRASQTYGDPSPAAVKPPESQRYVVVGSVAALLIYFCILREENDTDLQLTKSLFERIGGMEEEQIKIALKSGNPPNKEELLNRLQELIAERNQKENLRAKVEKSA